MKIKIIERCMCKKCSEIGIQFSTNINKEIIISYKDAKIYYDNGAMRYEAAKIKFCPFCGRLLVNIQEEI